MFAALAFATLMQAAAPAAPERVVAFDRPEGATAARLTVSSSSFLPSSLIPAAHSGYGKNLAPAVSWSAGPAGTRSYVLIVETPDAGEGRPLLHWLAYDIPAETTELPAKSRNRARTAPPLVFSQGVNDHGGLGWTGPYPAIGDPTYRYQFQVFALDRRSVAKPGADRDTVLRGMAGHVLAKGEMIGLYAQIPAKPRKVKTPKGQAPQAETQP